MIKYLIPILLFLLSCRSVKTSSVDTTIQEINAIEVQENTPFFGESFYRIFHVGPFVVYQSQYQFDSSVQRIKFDSTDNVASTVTENEWSEKRNQFFVFHRDSSYGFIYDPHRSNKKNRRLPVDSTLHEIKGTNNFETLLTKKSDTSSWNDQRTELKEVYVQKASKDTPTVRFSIFYSSSLNPLKTTLNSVLDSVKKMKFYKYEYLIEEFYSEKENRLWPAMKIITEMKEIKVTNLDEIMQYINSYKNSIMVNEQSDSIKKK